MVMKRKRLKFDHVHTMLPQTDNATKWDSAKILVGFHTIPAQFERKFVTTNLIAISVIKRLDFYKGEVLVDLKSSDKVRFKSVEKWSYFIVFECQHCTVFNFCLLDFYFEVLLFSSSAVFGFCG